MSSNGPLRSKQGCWTCRLRRKKCDERHPTCSTCDSLAITCYGYGSKPEWMDGGDREKAMANSIKQIVKHTSRRKGRLGFSIGLGRIKAKESVGAGEVGMESGSLAPNGVSLRLAPKESRNGDMRPGVGTAAESPGSSTEPLDVTSNGTSPQQSVGTSNTSHSPAPELPPTSSTATDSSAPTIAPSDAVLLMHFLDNVFPLQFPMYTPSIMEGGRGWFLSLLLRTKPLYHAALALSSYHQGIMVYGVTRERARGEGVWLGCPAQERHIQMCLKAFQEQIEESKKWVSEQKCPSDTLGFMGCVVQLTYFELFAGRGDTWQIHLRAATDMFSQGYELRAHTLNLTESLESIAQQDLAKSSGEGLVTEEVATFRFFSGILIWLDVLSCVTTGNTPRCLMLHEQIIGPKSAINLENIIGCKNWVVREIGRIATLHEWKMVGLMNGMLKAEDLEDKAEQIRGVIREGLAADCMESLGITNTQIPAIYYPHMTSRLFALAARIYLHFVVYGFESCNSLAAIMAEGMLILRSHMPAELMRAIVFPLYIFGCNAREEDEDFFRNVLSISPVLDPSMEHREKLLPLMEKIWSMRKTSLNGWSWQNNLLLSKYNLLLV